jgi:glycosyltransferase involved in cell wall biosynthesis
MKVVYATRLFSGLESSFKSGIWNPTGVPTIYSIIEYLDKEHDSLFIFSAKDTGKGYYSSWTNKKDECLKIQGLNQNIHVLTGVNYFPNWLGRRTRMIFREIRQTFKIIRTIIKFKPDLVYCDHANVFVASILSRFWKEFPVVFRVMGAYPFMKEAATSKNFYLTMFRWAYRSPFELVVCTQDGSGVEPWLERSLNPEVKRVTLLNGVYDISFPKNPDKDLLSIPTNKIKILFIGRLEEYKGCYDFVEAMLILLQQRDDVYAVIVGIGNESNNLKKMVYDHGKSDSFMFIDRLPHSQVFFAHSFCDIYVSMNHLGNLSNSNLEAIKSNQCMIILNPQPEHHVDIITKELLGNSVEYIDIKQPNQLSNKLNMLCDSPDYRQWMSKEIACRSKNFLWSWNERINTETELLESIVRGNSV